MAKQTSHETLSPLSVGVGAVVVSAAFRRTAAVANYVFGRRPQVHLCFGPYFYAGLEQAPVGLRFGATPSGYVQMLDLDICVDPDVAGLVAGLRFVFPASNTGRARLTIGGASVVFSGSNVGNGSEAVAVVNTTASGTGWQRVTLELERLTGGGSAYVRNLCIQDQPIISAGDLPDPVDD